MQISTLEGMVVPVIRNAVMVFMHICPVFMPFASFKKKGTYKIYSKTKTSHENCLIEPYGLAARRRSIDSTTM